MKSQSRKQGQTKKLPTSAEEFDRRFDQGESIFDLGVDPAKMTRPGKVTHTTLDLPASFMAALDQAATRRGVTRQSLIKMWLYERVKGEKADD